jgi:hypothetical protein
VFVDGFGIEYLAGGKGGWGGAIEMIMTVYTYALRAVFWFRWTRSNQIHLKPACYTVVRRVKLSKTLGRDGTLKAESRYRSAQGSTTAEPLVLFKG